MLQLLADAFRKSQIVTDIEFIAKLEQNGIEYTVFRIDTGTYIDFAR